MFQDVVSVKHLGGYRLHIRFDDGVEGDLDFSRRVRRYPGMLARLRDPRFFAKVFVHPEFGTVSWPGEIDLDTVVLYSRVTGKSIRSLLTGYKPPPPRRKPAKRRATKV